MGPATGFERASDCLGGIPPTSPDVAECGPTCRLAAPTVAGRGLLSLGVCHRWLPVWLPTISLAWLMFERSNVVLNPRQVCGARVRDSYHLSWAIAS
jgi:hypothetical protein